MNQLESAILKTLSYSDIFDYPLTADEVFRYLISDLPPQSFSFNSLAAALSDLIQFQKIIQHDDYFALNHRQQLFTVRSRRALISQKKLHFAQTIADKLTKLPHVLGIFVTGNLSMRNAEQSDDIDLLILTRGHHLWTTRFLITLYLEYLGIRRRPNDYSAYQDQICANMYLDETTLSLPQSKRNLYTAHEVAQAQPLINKASVYERFLTENSWIKLFLPNFNLPTQSLLPPPTDYSISKLESLAYKLQHWYMRRKITRETITPHAAFFHPRNTTQKILSSYQAKIAKLHLLK